MSGRLLRFTGQRRRCQDAPSQPAAADRSGGGALTHSPGAPQPPPPTPLRRQQVRGIDLVYDGAPLTMEPKLDYIKRKGEERAAREAAAPPAAASGPASRKRRAEGEPGEGAEAEGAAGEGEGGDGGDAQAPEEPELGDYEPGCILHFDFGDAEFAEAPTYGLVKDTFGGRREGGVQFVEYAQVGAGRGGAGAGLAGGAENGCKELPALIRLFS